MNRRTFIKGLLSIPITLFFGSLINKPRIDDTVMGFKQKVLFKSGYIYAPYIPVIYTKIIE